MFKNLIAANKDVNLSFGSNNKTNASNTTFSAVLEVKHYFMMRYEYPSKDEIASALAFSNFEVEK